MYFFVGSQHANGKEQDSIIHEDLTIEIKREDPGNDDVLFCNADDPLATESLANESTRQNKVENITDILEVNNEKSVNAEIEPNKGNDLGKLDTGQNQNNDKFSRPKITDTTENVSFGKKDKTNNDNIIEILEEDIENSVNVEIEQNKVNNSVKLDAGQNQNNDKFSIQKITENTEIVSFEKKDKKNKVDNVSEILDKNIENSVNVEIELNKVNDLDNLDTGQNQTNDKYSRQKITDDTENVSSGKKVNKDIENKIKEQEKKEVHTRGCKRKKEEDLDELEEAKRSKIEKNIAIKKAFAKYDISSKVSVDNIINTGRRPRRKRYDFKNDVPTEDDDDDDYETVGKTVWDMKLRYSRRNDNEKCKRIRQRRHSVFEKNTPKTDFEDIGKVGNKVPKRRKSVDCGQIKNWDEIDKMDAKQNYKEKDSSNKLPAPRCQSNEESVVLERNKVNEVIKAQVNQKITDSIMSPKQDANNVSKTDIHQKYQDYDIFKGPLPKNFKEKREAELRNREAVLNAMKNRKAVVNVVKIQEAEMNSIKIREIGLTVIENQGPEREKPDVSSPGKSTSSDLIKQNPTKCNINDKYKSKKSDENGKKDIRIGSSEGGRKNSSLGVKVKKKVSFHPDIVTSTQECQIIKNDIIHNDDDNQIKGPKENKSNSDNKCKKPRNDKQNKANDHLKNKSVTVRKISREDKKSNDNQNKGYTENSSVSDYQSKNPRSNEEKNAEDYQNKSSGENRSITDYHSKCSRQNKQKKDGDNPNKESIKNKNAADYQTSRSRVNKQYKTDGNQNKGSKENKTSMDNKIQSHRENKTDFNTNAVKERLLDDFKSKQSLEIQNKDTRSKESDHEKNNDVVKNLNLKATGKNKYGLSNEELIELEPMNDESVTNKPHRRTLLDDFKYKRLLEMTNKEHDIFKKVGGADNLSPPPPRQELHDDPKSKKEKIDILKNDAENKDICGENKKPRRRLLDDLKYKNKNKPYKNIFDKSIRGESVSLENMRKGSNLFESSNEMQYKDFLYTPFTTMKGRNVDYKRFSSNLFDDLNENRSLNDMKEDYTVDEILYQKRKGIDSNVFEHQDRGEKIRKHDDKETKQKRDSIDNKVSGCELLDEPKNKNSKEKKTDSSDKHFKEKEEVVDNKTSEDKSKKSRRSDNDKNSKHRGDESSDKKYSERKSLNSSRNKTTDEIKKDKIGNKDRVAHGLEGEKKDSITNVSKHGNVKDSNKKAVKRRRSEENSGDKNKQISSHGNSDFTPTSSKKAKTKNEKSTKDSPRNKFDDLFNNDSEQNNEEDFRTKILEARALESEDDEVEKFNKRRLTKTGLGPNPFLIELPKHMDNIKTIMRWTNATPIRRFTSVGYECAFCEVECYKPGDLKMHTLECHHKFSNAYFIKINDMADYFVKLDITDLECYICTKKLQNVQGVMNHLSIAHRKKIYGDIKNHIVPFKFDPNDFNTLTCFMCSSSHTSFDMLLEHTITNHCRNYICKECDMGFVNLRKLTGHQRIHEKGRFKCAYCDKTYETITKKTAHEKTHKKPAASRCAHCGEPFVDNDKKVRHLREVHGVGLPRIVCNACNSVFTSQEDYLTHMKLQHMLQRQFECTECHWSCFSRVQLRYHMETHKSERKLQCDICFKMFMLKCNLDKHLQAHNEEKRFTCERCGKQINTKNNWRKHMIEVHHENI